MGPLERRLRHLVNPVSTGLTRWWLGAGRRQVPARPTAARSTAAAPEGPLGHQAQAFTGVRSPGRWVAPPGQRPGWDWLPEHGALPDLRGMPRRVRIWFRTPFLDRYAHEWMWWHGGWSVLVPADPPPPPAGVREPRRPGPRDRAGTASPRRK